MWNRITSNSLKCINEENTKQPIEENSGEYVLLAGGREEPRVDRLNELSDAESSREIPADNLQTARQIGVERRTRRRAVSCKQREKRRTRHAHDDADSCLRRTRSGRPLLHLRMFIQVF